MHRRKQSCRNPCVALETKPGIREAVTTNKQAVIFYFFRIPGSSMPFSLHPIDSGGCRCWLCLISTFRTGGSHID